MAMAMESRSKQRTPATCLLSGSDARPGGTRGETGGCERRDHPEPHAVGHEQPPAPLA
jgi:hypothetical protein